jgi:hypothetical protein
LLGFLIGSAAASIVSQPRAAEAPESDAVPNATPAIGPAVERVRRHAKEALAAARVAAAQTEQELQRQFDEMRRRQR